ncbi:MAG: NAD(P)-binding domain-containing protein, partial [Calditrichaeota bacterium]|nr:NAD(P)-binding domain-containing protein [Calditrichota bacterium]
GGEIKDVIIVGAGPAGLTAALSCIQHKLSYLVLDQQGPGGTILQYPRRKLVMTHPVEIPLYGWLRNTEYTKEQLLDIWEAAIEKFDLEILNHHKVNTVKKDGEIFRVVTEKGDFYAHSVVLAMGRRGIPRKLNVPGEEMPKVMYQLIDAQAYNGNHLLVVGGGDSAVEAAIGLARQKGNQVTISYRKHQFFRIKKKNEERIGRLIKERKIQPVFDSNVLEIAPDAVKLRRHEEVLQIPNEFVFVFAGGIPPFKMMKEMGIRFGGETRAWTQE